MTPERWQQIERLYYAALEREPDERAAFLESACPGDENLRREVASLVVAGDRIGSFLEPPADDVAAETLASAPQPSVVGQTLGRYRILSFLSRGGMGEVYLAEDTTLGRKVALKLLPAAFTSDRERLRRFKHEARAASALNHPNIITIYEIGQAGSAHYLATEYIEGETLRQRIEREPLSLSSALDIAVQAASALAAAHAAGITHRDIKPENVMVRPDGLVKVLDFGLAKLTEGRAPSSDTNAPTITTLETAPGEVRGTINYMSPEQARGLKVDHRTDIFSLGVMLYELVAGRRPFEGATASDVIAEILRSDPLPVSQSKPDLPPELERMISRMLAKEREARYGSASELFIELQRIVRKYLEKDRERTYHSPRGVLVDLRSLESPADSGVARTAVSQRLTVRKWIYVAVALVLIVFSTAIYLLNRDDREGQSTNKQIHSLAVLPFVSASADPNVEYLSDGITESLINSFSQLPQLKVIARTTAFRYKGKDIDTKVIREELRVDAIIMGKVTLQGDTLIVQADLLNTADGSQIWGERYGRRLQDIFAVQGQIANEIAAKLRLRLPSQGNEGLSKRYTDNIGAYQNYLQGRAHAQRRIRESLLTAIRYYQKAIEEDTNYTLAYAGLTDAYTQLVTRAYIAPDEGRRKAKEAASKAISLDQNLAEAYTAIGQTYIFFAPYDFPNGDRDLQRAIELSPSLALAHQFLAISLNEQGRLDEGLEKLVKARELDPLSPTITRNMAWCYLLKRDYGRALELHRQAKELGPPFILEVEVESYIQNGLLTEALAELEKAKRERKDDPVLIYSTGMVYAAQGKRAEAFRIIKELEQASGMSLSPAYLIARVFARMNEKELAFAWLERSLGAGAISVFYKDAPFWDTIRHDPRFSDLLRRMRVPV
jgi:eukaryotic-like serine/threonine-protein kinase